MDSWHDDDENLEESDFSAWKALGKDSTIFLIDCSPKMHQQFPNADGQSEDTPFKMALRCVHSTLRNKIFASPNDVIGALMYGSTNKVGVRDFNGLSLLAKMGTTEGDSILKLEQLLEETESIFQKEYGGSSNASYSIHEALWQCQAMFNEVTGKVATKTILLFTCNDDPHAGDSNLKKQALKKAQDLKETDIILDLLPLPSDGGFEVSKFFIDMLPDNDELTQFSTGDDTYQLSSQKVDDLLRIVRKRIHKKRSVGKIDLDLGNGVVMAVSTYNLVQRAYKPSKVILARDTNEPIIRQRNFVHPKTGAPLLPSDIDMYQEYGERKITFTPDEVKATMVMGIKPGLKLIGFRPLEELKFSQYVRPCNFIYPDEMRIKGSRTLFSALLQRCLAKSVMILCSYKSRERSAPTFVGLIPQDELKENQDGSGAQIIPPGFSIFYLPFSDDIRTIPDEAKYEIPKEGQVDVATQLARKLKMKSYNVEAFENPVLQAHYRLIEALALEKSEVEAEPDCTLPPVERQRKKIGNLANEFCKAHGYKGENTSTMQKKKSSAVGGGAAYFGGDCFRCKRPGHWANNCPALKKSK